MEIYLAFGLCFTLMPIITSLPFMFNHPYTPMNLEPFIDVTYGRGDFIWQVGLNVIMTIPFGFLFPLVKNKKPKLLKIVLYTFLLSLSIEVLQPLVSGSRSSDITDTRYYHEIYLSNSRKCEVSKLKTVIRHPIKKIK